MKKKLKDFFNSLEARPEVIAHGCQKEVCQLRSHVSGIDSNRIYSSPKVYNRITRITVHLQGIVSGKTIIHELRKIKRNKVVKIMKNIEILFIQKLIILCVCVKMKINL
jgi:hypothetical protein